MKGQCERCMFEDTDECEAVMKNNECVNFFDLALAYNESDLELEEDW